MFSSCKIFDLSLFLWEKVHFLPKLNKTKKGQFKGNNQAIYNYAKYFSLLKCKYA